MAFQVENVTVTGCTAAGRGFDLVLDAGSTRVVGLTQVLCDEIAPGVERRTVPLDLVLNWSCTGDLLACVAAHCPDAVLWFTEFLDTIAEVLPAHLTGDHSNSPPRTALVDVRENPDVDCHCGEELCYWDASLGMVICVE